MAASPNTTSPAPNPFAQARFLLSAARLNQLPQDTLPEVAFAGRSNAGKSSALNLICQQKALARVSRTPGRTQLLNLFELPDGEGLRGRLMDLPGYGFAQVPLEVRHDWGRLVGGYVEKRPNLRGLVVVMDIRHPLTELDRQMLGWCESRGLATHVLLTKADKLGHGAAKGTLLQVRKQLQLLDPEATVQIFSAQNKVGAEEVREVLNGWLTGPE